MRVRALIVGATLVVVSVLGPVSIAYAQETTEAEVSHEAELCIEILQGGGEVDECHEAPGRFLAARDEVIWGVISFAVLAALLMRFAVPAARKAMAGRTERIRSELGAAERAKADADAVLEDYRAQLADASNEANRVIEEARRSAGALRVDLQARAQADIAEIRARAAADVEAARVSAIADLRSEVAALAIGAAEAIVQQSLDHETKVQLIEQYIRQVGSSN